MQESVKVPYNHKDIMFKAMSGIYKNEVLELYQLKLAKVVDIVSANVPIIEIKDPNMDVAFVLKNNTVAHFEYECSEPTDEDQLRYIHYDVELYRQRKQKIHRIVIYGAGVEKKTEIVEFGRSEATPNHNLFRNTF